jgi:hypothetical protein
MADIYRVIYVDNGGQSQAVYVSATSEQNAVAGAKSNDKGHKQQITATVVMHNIVAGS